MAISNLGELKSELSAYLFHQRLTPRYDNCIQLFETAANSRLRVRQMELVAALTTVNGLAALPTDYLLWRTVQWRGQNPYVELDYIHPAYYHTTVWQTTDVGNPQVFSIVGPNFLTVPQDNTADIFLFHYYQKIPTIVGTDNAATNWLLTAYPNAYLFGVITELAAVQRNAEMAQLYKARRDEAFAEIIQLSALTTGATSPQVRTATYF